MPSTCSTDKQYDIMYSKFSRKDGLILVCGVVTFFILTHVGESLFGSSVKVPIGIIIACTCWIISSWERYTCNATQQLNMVIDRIHRENECLKSNLAEQDEMLAQHQLKQFESENKLREKNHKSKQKCEKVKREMEKFITRSNLEMENIKTALVSQHELESQMYKDRCISLTEHLRTAMTEGYSLETQLQSARIDIQQKHEAFEQYKKSSKKGLDAMKTQLQIAWINFQKEREEYEENKMSSQKRYDIMVTKLQTAKIEFQKQCEKYDEYDTSSKRKIYTLETQLTTAGIEFQKEHEEYEEYKKSSRKRFDSMETQLQKIGIDMQKNRETYEEYEKSCKKKIYTLDMEKNNYKELLQKLREIANKYKDSERILQTCLLELEKTNIENNSLKLENKNLNKRVVELKKKPELPTCSICMERERNTYIDPCGHTFCMVCATEVMCRNRQCPVCRIYMSKTGQLYLN